MPGRSRVLVGVVIVVVMALVGGLVRTAGASVPERDFTGDWGTVAFVFVIATPAILALVGTQRRPWVLVAAGVVLVPLCFLSFSFLFFPLIVPAVLFRVDATTRPRAEPRSFVQCLGAVLSVLFVVAAVLSLFAHADPVTWHTATSSGSASDVITTREAVTSLAFLAAAVAVASLTPPDGARP
jgi:hypothetical protein